MSELELLSRGACRPRRAGSSGSGRYYRLGVRAHRFACGRLPEIQIVISGVVSSTTRSSSIWHSLLRLSSCLFHLAARGLHSVCASPMLLSSFRRASRAPRAAGRGPAASGSPGSACRV